jgi:uncharacterized membrane protein (DUF2068 family)
MTTARPAIVTSATVLLLLLSLFNLSVLFQPADLQPPLPVQVWAVAAGVVGLIGLVGLWGMKRWGRFLSLLLSALSMLLAVPGIFLAPTLFGKAVSVGLIIGYGLTLSLLLLPVARAAFASQRAGAAA